MTLTQDTPEGPGTARLRALTLTPGHPAQIQTNHTWNHLRSATQSPPRHHDDSVCLSTASSFALIHGIDIAFSSSAYLDVSVQRVPPPQRRGVTSPRTECRGGQEVPFGNPRIQGCMLLPWAYRSLPRPSSATQAKPSPRRHK